MLNNNASSVCNRQKKKNKELIEIERLHAPKALRSLCQRYKRQALRSNIKATVRHFWQSPAGMTGMTTTHCG